MTRPVVHPPNGQPPTSPDDITIMLSPLFRPFTPYTVHQITANFLTFSINPSNQVPKLLSPPLISQDNIRHFRMVH